MNELEINETIKTIYSLRSIRKFSEKEISENDMETILDASVRAANSGGRQIYSIIVIDDKELLAKHFYNAYKALVFLVDYNRWRDCATHLNYSIPINDIRAFVASSMDTMLAAQTAAIAAKSLGIDSLFTTSLYREKLDDVYKMLNLPEKYCFPYVSLCLGYALEEPEIKKGRVKKGVIHYGKYQRLSNEELDKLIEEYDDEDNHLSLSKKEKWVKEGFKHYLDLYYSRWARPSSKAKMEEFYRMLEKTGFLHSFALEGNKN